MNATENRVTGEIVDAAMKVHTTLGPGLLESSYTAALAMELADRKLKVRREQAIQATYLDRPVGVAYRADMIVEDCVIVEVKSLRKLRDVDPKQLLTYLRHSCLRLGLLLNSGEAHMRNGITRIAN